VADTTQIIYCEGEPAVLPEYYNNGNITLFSGGLEVQLESAVPVSTIDQYDIVVDFSTQNFGDLAEATAGHSGCSNSIHSFCGYQTLDDTPGALNKVDKSSFQTGGTASIWGDLIDPRLFSASFSNGVYGIWAGGIRFPTVVPTYATQRLLLVSGGSTSLWDDSMTSTMAMASGANDVYGLVVGGDTSGSDTFTTDQWRFTFSSSTAGRTWGDLDTAKAYMAGASDNIDIIAGGGIESISVYSNQIQRFNITNGWDYSEWSYLAIGNKGPGAAGNMIKALFGGGENPSEGGFQNSIESIEYANGRLASSYNTLSSYRAYITATSGGGGQNNPITYPPEAIPVETDPCYKGLFVGGEYAGDYIVKMNIKSAATSQLYNGLLQDSRFGIYGTSNGTTMLVGGNNYFSSVNNTIDQLEFAIEADSTVFGYLSTGRTSGSACSNQVSSFWVSGDYGGETSIEKIDYASGTVTPNFGVTTFIEIGATTTDGVTAICGPTQWGALEEFRLMAYFLLDSGGATIIWGELTGGRYQTCGIESDTYAIFWAGSNWDGPGYATWIDVFEFAAASNATVWGNIEDGGREYTDSCEDEVTGVLGTGYDGRYYTQYDHILFASQSDATFFADLHTPWDRHHDYASASGGSCYAASGPPSASCEDLVAFDLYSYIGFQGITFDSNMEDISLFEAKDRDVDLHLKGIIITDRLDPSINNLRSFHIDNCLFNTGKTIYLKHITDLDIKDLTINTDTIYHETDFDVMNIEKCRVFILNSTINITEQDGNTLNFNSVNFIDAFVKEMNVITTI